MAATSRFPAIEFAKARNDDRKKKLPQCIAHRGYKAAYPENSLLAFEAAIEVGAQAIETDIHITKDETVVLSHDPTLKRCFGRTDKIIDCTWEQVKDLKTTREPHVPMPRLTDLLDLLSKPGNDAIWCLLDIKMDNDADAVMRLIASTIKSHKPSATTSTAWTQRVVLGIWAAKYLPLCLKYLPGFPVMHIGFSTTYARHFLKIDNVGFNMLFPMLVAPGGKRFIHDAKQVHHRQVVAWTVNSEDGMRWCMRHGLDGLITDDPKLFNHVKSSTAHSDASAILPLSIATLYHVVTTYIMVVFFSRVYRKRFLPIASRELINDPAIK